MIITPINPTITPVQRNKNVRTERSDKAASKPPVKDRRRGERRHQRSKQQGFELRSGRDRRRRGNIDITT